MSSQKEVMHSASYGGLLLQGWALHRTGCCFICPASHLSMLRSTTDGPHGGANNKGHVWIRLFIRCPVLWCNVLCCPAYLSKHCALRGYAVLTRASAH